jgi:hypothetical protein
MAAGDIGQAVIECVNAALKARGFDPPYDRTQTMSGQFRYQFETIIAFHRLVRACLATKGLAYGYPESIEYMNQTLAMTLRQIYATITTKTGTSVHFSPASALSPAVKTRRKPSSRRG